MVPPVAREESFLARLMVRQECVPQSSGTGRLGAWLRSKSGKLPASPRKEPGREHRIQVDGDRLCRGNSSHGGRISPRDEEEGRLHPDRQAAHRRPLLADDFLQCGGGRAPVAKGVGGGGGLGGCSPSPPSAGDTARQKRSLKRFPSRGSRKSWATAATGWPSTTGSRRSPIPVPRS